MSRLRSCVLIGGASVALAAGVARPPGAHGASANTAALQVAMGALGLYHGSIDGITGPRTRSAVVRFQRRKHLAADGIAGQKTRRRLGRRGGPALGSRPMRVGHRGWDVAALQFLLRARGFSAGGIDGGFGSGTLAAVRRFQRAAGLTTDDVAGPRTISALRRRTVNASTTTRRVGSASVSDPVRFLAPVSVGYTDAFGWYSGRRHTGLDYPLAMGDPVSSAGRGTVSFAGYNFGGYGNLVVVTHRLGFESWYAHLSSISVSRGQTVVGGTRIGAAGSTGRSTGPHLHFEVRRYGTPIDPRPRLLGAATSTESATRAGRTPPVRVLRCRPNGDARGTRDADPFRARIDRCP